VVVVVVPALAVVDPLLRVGVDAVATLSGSGSLDEHAVRLVASIAVMVSRTATDRR